MDIRPLKNESDYAAALARIDVLFDAKPDSAEGDELDVLTLLVERYEQIHWPVEAPDPVEFIQDAMEFKGLRQKDLAELLNSRSRASEILGRRRSLTLDQVRKISSAWNLPPELLIREYKVG